MWSEQKHASSWEVGGTTTSMVAAGEVIKMLGTMFHSFIWGGVNSRVDIAIWLHNVGVGVKMPGLPFPFKTEASALNNSLTFPLYLSAALLISLFCFVMKESTNSCRASETEENYLIWSLMADDSPLEGACLYFPAVAKSALIDIMRRSHTCKSCVTHCSVTTQKTVIRHGCEEKVTILLYID